MNIKEVTGLNSQFGASLVELMATVTIMGTVAGVGAPIVINHIEEAKAQVDLYNLRIVADAIRYAFLLKGDAIISMSEGPIETATVQIKDHIQSFISNVPLKEFIADPVHHKETYMLAEMPKATSDSEFVFRKQAPVGKAFETIVISGDVYYLTLQ